MKILVVGASGMIGSTVFRVLSESDGLDVTGTIRNPSVKRYFPTALAERLRAGIDVERADHLMMALEMLRPNVVINCAGLTKHRPEAENPLVALPINSLMPHRLLALCRLIGARLIHVSTDCVFSGKVGNYSETSFPDARDVYGKSKLLGEVSEPGAVTVRTSTIGHELCTTFGLLEWFLLQQDHCKGFSRAIFSGLPTVVLASVIRDEVLTRPALEGLYHIAASPINKFELLSLIAAEYGKNVTVVPDDSFVIDRSLDAARFRAATGYAPPGWPELIKTMRAYHEVGAK